MGKLESKLRGFAGVVDHTLNYGSWAGSVYSGLSMINPENAATGLLGILAFSTIPPVLNSIATALRLEIPDEELKIFDGRRSRFNDGANNVAGARFFRNFASGLTAFAIPHAIQNPSLMKGFVSLALAYGAMVTTSLDRKNTSQVNKTLANHARDLAY